MSDAEDYDLNPEIRPGRSVDQGFQDRSAAFPRIEYIGDSDVNLRARGGVVDQRQMFGLRSARVASTASQSGAPVLSEPATRVGSRYPLNTVTETRSGHIIELDDSPGHERINFRHRTGSKIEVLPDGSIVMRSTNKAYEIVASDKEVSIRGSVNVVIGSNANIRVQGDANMEVDGDLNQLVNGNHNLEVVGNQSVSVRGNQKTRVTGGALHEVRGNEIRRHLSNYRERTVGEHRSEVGGDWYNTVEGEIHERSYGQIQASYFGGFVTLNGKDKDDTDGEGSFESKTIYHTDIHGTNYYGSGDVHIGGDYYGTGSVHVAATLVVDGTVTAPTFDGNATTSTFATTAGTAPDGPSSPVTPGTASATSPTAKTEPADSEETVVDVKGTSDAFILDLDRSSVTGFNSRRLSTGEVISRARNKNLRTNSDWLQDQLDNGVILSSITSSNAPRAKRTGSTVSVSSGTSSIGQSRGADGSFSLANTDILRIRSFPENMRIVQGVSRSTRLSPRYRVSDMLAGDNHPASLVEQIGLSPVELATNAQLVAYNILEPLRDKYNDTFTISEGIYNLLPNEQIDSTSLTYEFGQGLAVGIQFPVQPDSFYYDAAQWIRNNLVFDKLVLSYLDYDPDGVNEPTLIVTVKSGSNAKKVSTEFNHTKIADNLLDLSDDS